MTGHTITLYLTDEQQRQLETLTEAWAVGIVILLVGFFVFKRLERHFAENL